MKQRTRICAMLMALALIFNLLPQFTLPVRAEDPYSGSCGENLTWRFDTNTGTLTIEGSGDMEDYDWGGAPWYVFCDAITTVSLPDGLTSIGYKTFYSCSSLTSVTIPESVISIDGFAFTGCSSLTSVTIPESVASIDWYAFEGCDSLTSVTISAGVTSIGDAAFCDCSSLTSVTIPESVTSIGDDAFGWYWNGEISDRVRVEGFTIYGYNGSEAQRYAEENEFNYVSLGDAIISGTCGENLTWRFNLSAGTLTIEGSGDMENFDYLENPSPWYDYCNAITTVSLPDGLTSIGDAAFCDCSSLTSVTIPKGVTYIGIGAFHDCSSLTSVTIPEGVTSIGEVAFAHCSSLTSVTIPESVTSIGESAFNDCSSLTSVTIPEGVTYILGGTFDGCSSLTSVTIPDGVTYIGNVAFSGCSSLTSVTIPAGVTDIGYEAFFGCSSLTSVTIPESVASIDDYAFGWFYKNGYQKVDGFTIYGYNGSEAQRYAEENEFCFANLDAAPVITGQPESVSVALGKTASFHVTATGENLKYQWQYQKPNSEAWIKWSGKTEASLSFKSTASNNGYKYRCVVSNRNGSVNSEAASLTLLSKPEITTQPQSVSAGFGKAVTFRVTAAGENLSYQWQYKKPNSGTWIRWSGKTAASLSLKATAANNDYQYRCVVSNEAGSVASEPATLNITGPIITAQPQSVGVAFGKTASFSVTATGENLHYQWQYKKPGSSSWIKWSGKTEASISFRASDKNDGYQYRCVVSNVDGSVKSNAATLTVRTAN